MEKIETIYNFRIEIDGLNYNPQYNHPIHGWVNLRTTSYKEEDGCYKVSIVFCDISNQNKYIKVTNNELALSIIESYKERNNLENIKKEYRYIN